MTVSLAQSGEKLIADVDGQRLQRGQQVTLGVRPEHLRLDGDELRAVRLHDDHVL